MDLLVDSVTCATLGIDPPVFPCNANAIQAVSLGLGAGGLALLFTLWLYHKVMLRM
jgi:hypothetical protein